MENVTVFRKSSPIQASAKVVIKDFVEVIQTSKPGEKFDSDVFMVGDTKMLIRVYPNGRQEDDKGYVEVYLVNEGDTDVTVKYRVVTEVGTVTSNQEVKANGGNVVVCVFSHAKCADVYKDKDFVLTAFVDIPGKNMKIWGSESANISEKYCMKYCKKLYEKMQNTNFSLVFNGSEVFCHKQVLAAASPVFEAMVGNEYLEAKESKANIVGISEEVGRAFVKFIYTGELEDEVLKQYAVAFLELGDMYDIQELKDLSEGELLIQLDKKNMLEFLSIGDDSNAKRLFEAALSMTKANISWLRSQVSIEQKSISSITKM